MNRHFNDLTPAHAEALALLAEELGEALQAIGKILRHGLTSAHPITGEPNNKALTKEIGDVRAAIVIATRLGILDEGEVRQAIEDKLDRVGKYLHHIEHCRGGTVPR